MGVGGHRGSESFPTISTISSEEQKLAKKLPAHTHLYFSGQTVSTRQNKKDEYLGGHTMILNKIRILVAKKERWLLNR